MQRARPGWTLALTSVAFFMTALDALVVVTALPSIQRDLHASISTLEWTVNAYALSFAAGIVTAAALGDRLGRRRMFVAGIVLFSVASAACALAPDTASLIAARTVQGIGAAVITPLALTILASAFPPERRGTIIGIWGGIAGLAIASGPLVGGAVTQGLDWHWIFWVNVPIGAVAAVLSMLRLAESRGPVARLDLGGLALISGGAVGLAWGLVRANAAGWGSAEVVATLVAGAVLLAGFLLWERRAAEPMLPLGLFRIRAFAAANATAFAMTAAIFSAAFLMSQWFQFGLGYSPLATGLRFLPWTATPMLVAPVAGVLSDRIGQRPVMVTGMALQGIGLGWIALLATTSTGYGALVLPLIVAGVGISMAFATTPTAALGAVPPQDMGRASGTNNTVQRFGGVFGVAIAGAVFAGNGSLASPVSFVGGFRPALAVVAGFSLVGAVAAMAVPRRRAVMPAAAPAEVIEAAVA